MGRSDEELVEACLAGEASAFDVLVARWEDRIRGAAFRFLGSDDEARDVAQEAFLKAYRALPGFKREARFSSWLYQIAVNLCRDRLRRRRGRPTVSLEALEQTGPVLASREPGAHELVQRLDLRRAVRRAIGGLSEEQREVLVLKEYQGLTFLEIAQALDVPLSTVKTRLYRGLGQLRLLLEEDGMGSGARVPAAVPRRVRAQ
jgi:RNA polymerase sigma-70 factor, ECF subfamily